MRLDLKAALNAVSDVVQNRPRPLREFDQIYMKVGDVVVHAEFLARKFKGGRIAFVGDGDAIGLCMAHLRNEDIIDYGPDQITIYDFDERQVNSVLKFAADYECADRITAKLYNVVDPLQAEEIGTYDAFHINPPWGQHNRGESVVVFLDRGIQLTRVGGGGVAVIADNSDRPWTNNVLARTQSAAVANGLVIGEMIPSLHAYHHPEAPDLRSCSMLFRKIAADGLLNERITGERLENFYGREQRLRVHYVREVPRLDPDKAADGSYRFELLES